MIQIPNLEIDRDGTDPDTHVMLSQDFGGNVHMVTLHSCQVKVLAERMGLLAPDIEAQRTIARLSRQLRILLDRIDTLDDWINRAAQRGHESLEAETIYSFATWELASEFVKDLPQPVTDSALPGSNGPGSGVIADGNGPKNGAIAISNPPENGVVTGQGQLPLAAEALQ
jgi:hypothetical protein